MSDLEAAAAAEEQLQQQVLEAQLQAVEQQDVLETGGKCCRGF